VNLIQHNSIL